MKEYNQLPVLMEVKSHSPPTDQNNMADTNSTSFSATNEKTNSIADGETASSTIIIPNTPTIKYRINGKTDGSNTKSSKVTAVHPIPNPLLYKLTDTPPPFLMLTLTLQQGLLAIAAPLTTVFIIGEIICAGDDDVIRARILSATFFMIGLSTFTMATIGVRLPVFQGPNFTYVLPLLSMLTLKEFQCPAPFQLPASESNTSTVSSQNISNPWYVRIGNDTIISRDEYINIRINELAGSLMLAGAIHFIVGATGMVGFLKRFVGPITLVPMLLLFGIQINPVVVSFSKSHWGIAMFTVAIAIILALYLADRNTPVPNYTRDKGLHVVWMPLHAIFAVVISTVLGWILCLVLTFTDALTNDPENPEFFSRVDSRFDVVEKMDWFIVPYPGQFGLPSYNISATITFLVATVVSVIDSIGNYSATARIAYAPQPPRFALNRGVAVEGIMVMLSGAFGCGHGTVAFNENIGTMTLSRCVSRSVFQLCGLLYIIFAIIGKVGALAITIPHPVIGGVQLITFGILFGVVLSYLQFVDLNSTRNVSILGISILFGIMMETWVISHQDDVQTGNYEINMAIKIFLSNPAFVGSVVACFLDNTIAGGFDERGLNMDKIPDDESEDDGNYNDETNVMTSKEVLKDRLTTKFLHGREVYRLPWLPIWVRKSRLARVFPVFDTNE